MGSTANGSGSYSMLDLLDGLGGRQFVDGRHREDWLAVIQRLHREPTLGLR